MKPYKLVIFDWDGTLMDSAAKIIECMQSAARQCALPVPSAEEVSQIIGISLRPAIQRLFDTTDEAQTDALFEAYKQLYLAADVTPCPLFPGVESLLRALKADGRVLAVATGKARRGLTRAWEHTQTGHYFSASRCGDEAESKPSGDMLRQILRELDISPKEAVMIGDTTFDMQMAQDAGVDRIGVSYGVHAQIHLEQHAPLYIVHSVIELEDCLLNR